MNNDPTTDVNDPALNVSQPDIIVTESVESAPVESVPVESVPVESAPVKKSYNNNNIEIDPPVSVPQPSLIFNNMKVNVMDIELGISARFNVLLFNDNNFVTIKNYTMTGNDYLQWGNDDEYVYQWVITQLRTSF